MQRPYVVMSSGLWFVLMGCAMMGIYTTKSDALQAKQKWIRTQQHEPAEYWLQSRNGASAPATAPA
jgi:thiol:disulfide interchange protein